MGRIHQLNSQIANMIAAGEVVERPMGVVKELVENAIDAGSTSITVTIEEGGMRKIVVQDNGCGMSAEDAEMAFERHATSKIQKEADLFAIHTLGFRGEALPSIASVSKVTLVTSDGDDNTRIVIAYGKKQSVGPYPCNEGTEITVEDLFYQTPARLKHMRSASYEASLIQDVLNKFALSHPEIAFHLINEGRDAFRTSGQGNLLEAVFTVYGRGASENAIPVDFSDFDYHVSGYIIKPLISRASRNMMHVFMNGRMIKTYKIYKAVQDAYEGSIPDGRYPLCVLNIETDPHLLDVNVHPSKWEIRISKEIQLELLIKEEIYKALHTEDIVPHQEVHEARVEYYEPISFEEELREEPVQKVIEKEVQEDTKILEEIQEKIEEKEEVKEEVPSFPLMEVIGQYHKRYILCEMENGLAIVDQSAAMRTIKYDSICKEMKEDVLMNDLLIPVTVHASNALVHQCDEINEALKDTHIVFEPFGNDTLIVRSLPAWTQQLDEQAFLNDVIDLFQNDESRHFASVEKKKIAERAARYVSQKVTSYTMDEMKEMIRQLSQCENPFIAADRKPVFIVLDEKQLMKEFKR